MIRKALIVLLVFALFIAGGVYVYLSNLPPASVTSPLQITSTPTIEARPTFTMLDAEKRTITTLVKQFYTTYLSCLQNPPREAGRSVSTYCQANNPYTTEEFIKNLTAISTARRGIDPVACSQNLPSSLTPDTVDFESPEQAVAIVVAQYGKAFVQKIPVVAVKVNQDWRVDSITCPRP